MDVIVLLLLATIIVMFVKVIEFYINKLCRKKVGKKNNYNKFMGEYYNLDRPSKRNSQ